MTWLDVGMPRMHGIEAAQRIRETVLDRDILFLSVERSPEFDQVALGYRSSRSAGEMKVTACNRIPLSG